MSSYHQHERWPGLLSAILTSGKDDLPRLVAADHIEECGDEWRADYIRKMIADKIGHIEYGGWDSGNPFGYDFGFQEHPDSRLVLVAHRGFICEVRGLLENVMTALPELVRKEGVERVVVTDREPQSAIITSVDRRTWRVAENSRNRWSWLEDFSGLSERRSLPPYVFRFLAGRVGENPVYREYDAEGEAERDASFALIAWAKSQPHPARITATPVSVDVTA